MPKTLSELLNKVWPYSTPPGHEAMYNWMAEATTTIELLEDKIRQLENRLSRLDTPF